MKKKNIFKKVLLSLVGAFVLFLLIDILLDWNGSKESFKEGWNDAGKDNIEMTKEIIGYK